MFNIFIDLVKFYIQIFIYLVKNLNCDIVLKKLRQKICLLFKTYVCYLYKLI